MAVKQVITVLLMHLWTMCAYKHRGNSIKAKYTDKIAATTDRGKKARLKFMRAIEEQAAMKPKSTNLVEIYNEMII